MVRVLFLCLGNICRSPMAEAVFQKLVNAAGLSEQIAVDSAGIGGWHAGERPRNGTLKVLDEHHIPHDWLRSRQIQKADLAAFDYIVAMDEQNVNDLKRFGKLHATRVFRLLELVDDVSSKDVPDPYYTGNFDAVFALVDSGCRVLLEKIERDHRLSASC